MDASAAARRRRRRRVPEGNRKRAPRACTYCKARKSKCIITSRGVCQRCMQGSLQCEFERQLSTGPAESEILPETQISPSATFATENPAERFMWPRFLSKLRESLSLDTALTPGLQTTVSPQFQLPRHTPDSIHRVREAAQAFPPQAVARFLVSVCNEHGTDSFHYFDTAQFSAELDEFFTSASSPLRIDSAFVCLAHATFALGSQWATLVRPGAMSAPSPQDGDPGRIFYQQARSLIPDIIELNSIRTVQAAFVIGVYLLPASAISSSYIYLGLALRKALALDLHQESEEIYTSQTEKELRRRTWWAVYSLERILTIKLNRPKSIDAAIISVHLPAPLHALDAQQAFHNVDHQLANARLMLILDKIEESSNKQEQLLDIEASLKQWKHSLPPALGFESIHPRSSSYRATFHLYLNYYFARIAMGKSSVVTRVRSHMKNRLCADSQPLPEDQTFYLAQSCIKAAKKILRLYEDVRRTGNLTRFSFTDFQGCSVATCLVLLAGILERDSDYDRHVSFGLDSLRKMADGNITALAGLKFVEALQAIAEEAVERLRQQDEASSIAAQNFAQTSDYSAWADWLARQPRQGSGIGSQSRTPPAAESSSRGATETLLDVQPVLDFTTWDGAAALQQLSLPVAVEEGSQFGVIADVAMYEPALPLTDSSEDPVFLMGLTGFDMMGFGFQN